MILVSQRGKEKEDEVSASKQHRDTQMPMYEFIEYVEMIRKMAVPRLIDFSRLPLKRDIRYLALSDGTKFVEHGAEVEAGPRINLSQVVQYAKEFGADIMEKNEAEFKDYIQSNSQFIVPDTMFEQILVKLETKGWLRRRGSKVQLTYGKEEEMHRPCPVGNRADAGAPD